MPRRSGLRVLTIVLVALAALGGCGAPPPPTTSPGELLDAYTHDRNVVHDVIDEAPGGSPDDRVATIAAYFGADELAGFLFGAAPCGARTAVPHTRNFECPPPAAVTDALGNAPILAREMLVRHDDGRLEIAQLYVTATPTGGVFADTTGRTYSGGLEDFQRHNTLLARDDQVLVAAEPAKTEGGDRLVVVAGSTAPALGGVVVPVLVGVAVVLAAAVAVLMVRRRRRAAG